jgi:hypothetical protein
LGVTAACIQIQLVSNSPEGWSILLVNKCQPCNCWTCQGNAPLDFVHLIEAACIQPDPEPLLAYSDSPEGWSILLVSQCQGAMQQQVGG